MFRFSLIVCISLIFGVTAKPYKPWNKLPDEAFQDTVMYLDGEGKMSWGMEVEPPEYMDENDYDIDPEMKSWESMTGGQEEQPLMAEEDLDELYHPSVVDLLKVEFQNRDALPAADIQAEPWQEVANFNQEPEEDEDDVDHPGFGEVAPNEPEQDWDEVYHRASEELDRYLAPLRAGNKPDAEIRVSHSEPEEDEDELYHHHDQGSPVQKELLSREVAGESEPEEDMDDLYHKDLLNRDALPAADIQADPWQEVANSNQEPEDDEDDVDHPGFVEAAPNEPEQDWDEVYHRASEELDRYLAPLRAGNKPDAEIRVSHSEPEEDEDELYHKDLLKLIPHPADTEAAAYANPNPFQRRHSQPEEDLDHLYHQ